MPVHALFDRASGWPAALVLLAVAVVLTLESGVLLGLVLPGSTTLVALGLWTSAADADPVVPVAVAAAASVGGALHGWRHGHLRRAHRGAGPLPLPARVEAVVQRARDWLATQGPLGATALVAGAHWVATARTLTPRVAGGAGVPLRLAGPAIAVSGTAWTATVVLSSRALGERVADASWAPVVVLAALVAVLGVRHWRRVRAASAG